MVTWAILKRIISAMSEGTLVLSHGLTSFLKVITISLNFIPF